jgi:hypothetical protein
MPPGPGKNDPTLKEFGPSNKAPRLLSDESHAGLKTHHKASKHL